MDVFELQLFLVQNRRLIFASVLPGCDIAEVFIVAQRLAFFGLRFLAEVSTTRFVAMERVTAHQLAELQEVCDSSGFFERLVYFAAFTRNADILPELFTQSGESGQARA